MRYLGLFCALLLLLLQAELAFGQTSEPPVTVASAPSTEPVPAPSAPSYDWWFGTTDRPIASGHPGLNPDIWQHTWGLVSFDVIPVGSKIAPNGVPYDPLFSFDWLLNIALSRDRTWYIFTTGRFWAQKPGDGITNDAQGMLDFSKRQIDLDVGLAWNFYKNFEARAFAYSLNNLNRGNSLERPFGYKDGAGVELRYYFPSTDFDRGLYRYLSIGYLPTKELVGNDGEEFHPSLFLAAHLAYDFIPEKFYVYTNLDLFFERPMEARILIADPGIACRPFDHLPNLEFRVGTENFIDLEIGYTRTLLYGAARIIW